MWKSTSRRVDGVGRFKFDLHTGIAPPGSNRRNHRQDQAALTVLAHQAGVACRRMHLSVHYHHDDPSDEGTLDRRPKSSRPKSSRRPAGGG